MVQEIRPAHFIHLIVSGTEIKSVHVLRVFCHSIISVSIFTIQSQHDFVVTNDNEKLMNSNSRLLITENVGAKC